MDVAEWKLQQQYGMGVLGQLVEVPRVEVALSLVPGWD